MKLRKYKFRPTYKAYSNIEYYSFLVDDKNEKYLMAERW